MSLDVCSREKLQRRTAEVMEKGTGEKSSIAIYLQKASQNTGSIPKLGRAPFIYRPHHGAELFPIPAPSHKFLHNHLSLSGKKQGI
jgi:hypothetical protein